MLMWRVLRVLAVLATCVVVLFAALPQMIVPAFARAHHGELRKAMQRANVVPSWVVFLGRGGPKPRHFCLQVDGFRSDTGLTRLYAMNHGCNPEPLRLVNDVRDTFHYRTVLRWWHLRRAGSQAIAEASVMRLARYYCEQDGSRPEEVHLSALVEHQTFTTGKIARNLAYLAAYDCTHGKSIERSRFSKLTRSLDGALELLP